MTYIYSGILSSDALISEYPDDSEEMVFRRIKHPGLKVGVLFPQQAENQIESPDEITIALMQKTKISSGVWVYYSCWGGELDTIALVSIDNFQFDMATYKIYENASYSDLHKIFREYGIKIKKNGHFKPFVRGYWGEYGY